jgi:hypothetical protein
MEKHHMRTKSQAAWETAARCATLAQEEDDPQDKMKNAAAQGHAVRSTRDEQLP